jgi:hypothetical protein
VGFGPALFLWNARANWPFCCWVCYFELVMSKTVFFTIGYFATWFLAGVAIQAVTMLS